MDLTLFVRAPDRTLVAQIDDYQRVELIPRFNAVGAWSLQLPAESDAAVAITQDGAGIVAVKDDGGIFFSGPVDRPEREWSVDRDVLAVSGKDDLLSISDRIAYPEVNGAFGAAAYDVRTGVAETILREYVNYNAGPLAMAGRRVTGLTLAANTGLGLSVTGRARFQNLVELLQDLALAGGDLGFRIVQSGTSLDFRVYAAADKTATAIFSKELGNLRRFRYHQLAPSANYLIVGGGGVGTARTIVEGGDSASVVKWQRRIEVFRDRRDTTVVAELAQTRDEELDQQAAQTSLEIEPIDIDQLAFGDDYNLGDRVTVSITTNGVETRIQDVVREVHVVRTPELGQVVTPTIGTPGGHDRQIFGLFRTVRKVVARISNVERV